MERGNAGWLELCNMLNVMTINFLCSHPPYLSSSRHRKYHQIGDCGVHSSPSNSLSYDIQDNIP
jgi:hypothetical protein